MKDKLEDYNIRLVNLIKKDLETYLGLYAYEIPTKQIGNKIEKHINYYLANLVNQEAIKSKYVSVTNRTFPIDFRYKKYKFEHENNSMIDIYVNIKPTTSIETIRLNLVVT